MRFVSMVLLILFIALSAGALPEEPLASILQGRYLVSTQSGAEGNYLKCNQGQQVEVIIKEDSIRLAGLTHSPIELKNINQGPIGIPGPLVGFSQRRTTFKEVALNHYQVLSQHRDCEPLLSNIGCFAKKWRTTVSLVFFLEINEGEDSLRPAMELLYQPFSHVDREVCQLEQTPESQQ